MSAPQTTPLSELLGNDHPNSPSGAPNRPPPVQNPAGQFGQMPGPGGLGQGGLGSGGPQITTETQPVIAQQPSGPGQGVSAPDATKKEFFASLKEFDYKTTILVFAIILILSSGIFYSVLRPYVPGAVGSDGKVTLIGSLVAAIVGTLVYVLVRLVGKF